MDGGPSMFTLLRNATLREILVGEAPALLIALLVAEFFFKFHSFLLEAIAFLATWFVLSFLIRALMPKSFWLARQP
jgi:hypothetical protein